ncbi:MAG: hypothetical protein COV55_05105 [Candidatus Komeilibacteria bacterium CG11_big_fil_rev_8_21_14_0_20_36_20]|uniref:Uncharacterized protein n=1 Tax=Candidatus Komeilibacteria bacterium CG11_big_fil_rev_8_21_14_0_20_36_20 TaxID=1974477 RepID=A0A2H0NB18_9BACT|nr:MAG: hypothetical protein COV55_05105 [Candidatus Komeilibacteria bacterium CG11_big_fil_rev_8_21_14_0_20_36_20]PIR82078.1 MAG: hypothetical protein COU21_00340 [Candidatus Komeilibacteria bacterium CG10_big_fil_rev_8_21_14_0_10_36_65]PJC55702.1 MAG: hypothetical protein CO027_00725 [Candidatus Komeilibacteria bacterium CG_4_9_14_0_2_um_filter_36_13]
MSKKLENLLEDFGFNPDLINSTIVSLVKNGFVEILVDSQKFDGKEITINGCKILKAANQESSNSEFINVRIEYVDKEDD